MKVAKLSPGKVVRLLRHKCPVAFAEGEHSLISDSLTDNPCFCRPYWVPSTLVVWVLCFN
jgi:hypothetical protein